MSESEFERGYRRGYEDGLNDGTERGSIPKWPAYEPPYQPQRPWRSPEPYGPAPFQIFRGHGWLCACPRCVPKVTCNSFLNREWCGS